nr:hypothetical protein CFP56_44255 [Quercus suber]
MLYAHPTNLAILVDVSKSRNTSAAHLSAAMFSYGYSADVVIIEDPCRFYREFDLCDGKIHDGDNGA